MDQQFVGSQVTRLYSATTDVQEAKLCVTRQWRGLITQVRMSLTRTVNRTGEVTEALIIMLRTLAPSVTDVGHVQTDSGATTAVETRADGRMTLVLVVVI